MLEFDLQWAGPLVTLERYLQVLGLHKYPKLLNVCQEVCRFTAYKAEFSLRYKPSVVAALAVTISINVMSKA